jgi:hypothetical protein
MVDMVERWHMHVMQELNKYKMKELIEYKA